jgi:hypothetical protein
MENTNPPDSTNDEIQRRDENREPEVPQRRVRSHKEDQPKPRWQRFLETSGGTALITVVLGGVLGQFITWSIQNGQKEREFQQAWMKARGDQALVTYKEYVDQEQDIVKVAFGLIGNCMSASQDLILLTSPEFAPDTFVGAEKQRTAVRDKYNTLSAQWGSEREKLGLLMNYYHPGRAEVAAAWQNTQRSLTEYMGCARQWYLTHLGSTETANACKKEGDDLSNQLVRLNASLETGRQYAWEGWESPEKLKAALKK